MIETIRLPNFVTAEPSGVPATREQVDADLAKVGMTRAEFIAKFKNFVPAVAPSLTSDVQNGMSRDEYDFAWQG